MNADSPYSVNDSAMLQAARRRWMQRDWAEALEQFERACLAEPRNARAKLEYARALGQRYEVDRAEAILGELSEATARAPELAAAVAQSFRMIHRPERALARLEALRAAGCLTPPLLGELAVLYEQCHRLEEAREAIEACLSAAGGQPEPSLVLARILRLSGEVREASQRLESLLDGPPVSPQLGVRAWYELAAARDAQEDYAGAVQAVERGKAIQRTLPEALRLRQRNQEVNRYFASLYASLDPAMRDAWRRMLEDAGEQSQPIAHLLGFPRSGTTLLEQMLDAHPRLVSSSERPVFAREVFPAMASGVGEPVTVESLNGLSAETLRTLRSRYLRMMEAMLGESIDGRMHLDKNPNHTCLAVGLYRLFPESRFLCALRDPRDVVVSAYLQYFPLTEFSVSTLTWEDAANQYVTDMACGAKMEAWLGDAWQRVRYEDLVADPRRTLEGVLAGLGLDWEAAVDDYRERRRGALVHSPSRAAVRDTLHRRSIGRWRHYARWLQPVLATLRSACVAWGYDPE